MMISSSIVMLTIAVVLILCSVCYRIGYKKGYDIYTNESPTSKQIEENDVEMNASTIVSMLPLAVAGIGISTVMGAFKQMFNHDNTYDDNDDNWSI